MTVYRWRWFALVTLLIAEAMNLLDATIVTVAAPVISEDLGGGPAGIQWFGAAYTLPFAVLLITGGRLGDLAGRRRVFLIGVVAFALASLACAFAPSPGALIATRAVQGAAAALIIPQTIGLIRAMFEGAELARAMGAIGPVMGLSAVCGPVLGAVLTQADLFGTSWRAAFLVNVPLAVIVLAMIPVLREDRALRPPRLDVPGSVLAALGTGLVVHPLVEGHGLVRAAEFVAGVAVLGVFAFHQRHRARHGRGPLVEPTLFRDRGFPAALVTSTLFFAVVNGLMVVIVLQVQLGLGAGVVTAGLTLLPWSCGMAVSSWTAGAHLVPRYGPRVMFAGLAALGTGLLGAIAVYGNAPPHSYPWALPVALAVAGVGNGLFTVPFFTTALGRVKPHETGSAAGLLNAVQQFGGTLGVAALGTAFFHALGSQTSQTAAQLAFWIAVTLLALTTATATLMLVRPGDQGSARASNSARTSARR